MTHFVSGWARSIALLIVIHATLCAQAPTAKTYRITLDVSADEAIKGEIVSYLSREWRSLSDVVLVDNAPEFRIEIIAMAIHEKGGSTLGYMLSMVVAKPRNPAMVRGAISAFVEKETARNFLFELFTEGEIFVYHTVVTGPDLPKLCKKAVATIDGEVLEPERQWMQGLQDKYKKPNEQNPTLPVKNKIKRPQ